MPVTSLRFGDLRIEGESRAGDATWFRVHPPGLAFDAGRGALALAGAADLFLTHGHLDHALGVPFVLSQRSLHRAAATRILCPRAIAPRLRDFIVAASRLEEVDYGCEVVALAPGDRVEVGRDLFVEAFATDHVVPSLGYHLVRRRRRLLPALRGATAQELVERKHGGETIDEPVDEDWLTFCGDTGPGVFSAEQRLFSSRILLVECTFLGADLREKGGRFKHLHLDDLAAVGDRFTNEAVVLHHLSRRFRAEELLREARRRLPGLGERLVVWGAP